MVKGMKATGGINQKWKIVYVDEHKYKTTGVDKQFGFPINKPFYLVSKLPMNRVIQLNGGSNLVLHRYIAGRTEQQFYFDAVTKTLKSQRYKDRSIEIVSNGNSVNVRMGATNARKW
jgi:hypothetical protein